MSKDYSCQNLQRHNFKNEDLSGANFSYADIRGVNFTKANLKGTNFTEAKAGLKPITCIYLLILSFLLLIALGFIASASGAYTITINKSTLIPEISLYISDAVGLILFSIFSTIIIRKGLISGVGSIIAIILVGAVFVVVSARAEVLIKVAKVLSEVVAAGLSQAAATEAIALVAATAFVVMTAAISDKVAVVVGLLGMIGALAAASSSAYAAAGTGAGLTAALIILAGASLSALLARSALAGDEKQALIHNIGISLAAWRGTNFQYAGLTDANFTNAIIKNTDFQRANLTRVCWHKGKYIDFALLGDTYLYFKDAEVRKLLVSGQGENKDFNNRDFRGINLSGANLKNARFFGTNFYQANLQGADLTGAKLVRTQLEQANLTYATLTGACIEDWVITRSTKLNEVVCKYIFMKCVNGDKRDQRPPFGEFHDREFISFVQSILYTLELYHERDLDPKKAVAVLKNLADKYNEPLQIEGIERKDNGAIILKLRTSEWADSEVIKEEYQSLYNGVLTLSMQDPAKLLPQDNTQIIITKLAEDLAELKRRPPNYTYTIKALNIGGDLNIQNDGMIQNIQNSNLGDNYLVQGNNNQVVMQANQDTQLDKLVHILEEIKKTIYNSELSADVKEEIIQRILG
jgi:uncharacterized protein YjbI with pentapeptide repeats